MDGTQRANCSMVLQALQDGANPNVMDPNGRTPLHFMSGVGLAPAVVLLVHYGAQLDIQDKDGLTAMHMAAGYANAQTLKVLVAAGADPYIKGQSQGYPLEVVQALGDFQLAKWNEEKVTPPGPHPQGPPPLERPTLRVPSEYHPSTLRALPSMRARDARDAYTYILSPPRCLRSRATSLPCHLVPPCRVTAACDSPPCELSTT